MKKEVHVSQTFPRLTVYDEENLRGTSEPLLATWAFAIQTPFSMVLKVFVSSPQAAMQH